MVSKFREVVGEVGRSGETITFKGAVTIEESFTVEGDFTFGNASTDDLTVNGDLIVADDQKIHFGDGEDVSFEFDEDGTDDLRITTASALGVGLIATMGSGTATGSGGVITLTAGAGGATSGNGGAVAITGGSSQAGNSDGGTVTITPGSGDGSGSAGTIVLAGTSPVNATSGGIRTIQSVANVTEAAPTDAELDSAFGTPATLGRGFIGTIDDNDADTASILVWTSDASWYHVVGTKST